MGGPGELQLLSDGGVTSPEGFFAAAAACGLKESGAPDLALVVSASDCAAAGVFTRNRIAAAPVLVDRATLAAGPDRIRAVVANSGNANACTSEAGLACARDMQRLTARAVGCRPEQVLVLSTGLIGALPDMEKIGRGIARAAATLSPAGGRAAAGAIMTTDRHPKQLAVRVTAPASRSVRFTLGGMAKGAGMIHPDMATLLAVITADAAAPPDQLQDLLRTAVDRSFNRICVDGDTSTNDTVLLLAGGASGVSLDNTALHDAFSAALTLLCTRLAQAVVRDGEGASRFVTLRVTSAGSDAEALAVARAIATSPLVKTAFAGGDPNWGRILAAAGRAGVDLAPASLALWIHSGPDDTPPAPGGPSPAALQLVRHGAALPFREDEAAAIFRGREFSVRLDLGAGPAEATLWTCDLTQDYISINADYRT